MSIVPAPSTLTAVGDEGTAVDAPDIELTDVEPETAEDTGGCGEGGVGENETGRNDSATHSYQTLPAPVRRQIATRSSALLGR